MTRSLKRIAQLRVESLDLTSSRFGFFGSSFGARGELSRSDGSDEKREERNPVVSRGDCESAERRQEEKVETEHRDDRRYECGQAAPARRDEQNIKQQRELHRCRVNVRADDLEQQRQ